MKKWEKQYEEFEKTGKVPDELLPKGKITERKKEIAERKKEIDAKIPLVKTDREIRKLNEEKRRLLKEEKRLLKEEYKIEEEEKANGGKNEKQEVLAENFVKIGRIKEKRDEFQKEKEEIDAELKRRTDSEKAAKEVEKSKQEVDKQTKIIMEKNKALKNIEAQLKNSSLSSDERAKLEEERDKLKTDRDKAQEDLVKAQDNGKQKEEEYASLNASNGKYADASKEQLENEKSKLSTKISKCNFICNNLSKGKSFEEIELSLDNWDGKSYSGMKKQIEFLKQGIDKAKTYKEPSEEEKNAYVSNKQAIEESEKKLEELNNKLEKSLVPQSEFEKKHPRLSSFMKFFSASNRKAKKEVAKIQNEISAEKKNMNVKIIENEKYEEEYGKPEDLEKQEAVKSSYENLAQSYNEHNEFIEYIKATANKSPEELKKEKLERARAKQQAYKEAAHKRETEKFGKTYADKSYQPKEEEKGDEGR